MRESLAAVVAHGLLNSLAVVTGGMATLGRAWDGLSAEQRRDITEMALSQAEVMADGLDHLPRGARHRLATHLFVMRRACETLMREGASLPVGERVELLRAVSRQSAAAAGVLRDVVRGLPHEVQTVLDRLDERREASGEGATA